MTGIYKITNLLNGKSYIGLSTSIETRWQQHRSEYNQNREKNKVLYQAFNKYGIDNFNFEVLEECSPQELSEKEKFYIDKFDTFHNGYNATSGGEDFHYDGHPGHKLTKEDIIDIRERYNNLERKKEVYSLYKDRIGESGFHKIWNGATWKGILDEVYTPENKEFHLHDTANKGSQNGRAKLTEEDVKNIRLKRKNGESLKDVYELYKDKMTYKSFSNVWSYQNWKNVIV